MSSRVKSAKDKKYDGALRGIILSALTGGEYSAQRMAETNFPSMEQTMIFLERLSRLWGSLAAADEKGVRLGCTHFRVGVC